MRLNGSDANPTTPRAFAHSGTPTAPTSAGTLSAVLAAALVSSVGVGGAMLLGALRQIVAARYLGPDGFGIIGLVESFESIVIRVAPMGLTISVPILLARAVAERDRPLASRVIGTVSAISLLLLMATGLAIFLLADVLSAWLGTSSAGPVLRIWSAVIVGLSACQIVSAVFRGLLRITAATVVRDVVPNVLVLVALLTAIVLGLRLPELALAYGVGATLAAVIGIVWLRWAAAAAGIRPRADGQMVGPLLAVTAPALTMVVAGQLMRQINVPILAAATDFTTVGYFSSALFLATATEAAFTALTLVYMPYASRILVDDGPTGLAAIQPAIGRWTYLVSLVPIAVLSAFAEPIIQIAFGAEYLPAAAPLRIILIGLLIRSVIGPRNSVLLAVGRGNDVSLNFAVSLVVAIATALVLTPTLGMLGSAISFAIGFVVRSVMSEVQLRRVLPGSGIERRELAAAATIALFVLGIVATDTPLTWIGPLAAVFATLFIFQSTRDRTDDELLSIVTARLRRRARPSPTANASAGPGSGGRSRGKFGGR